MEGLIQIVMWFVRRLIRGVAAIARQLLGTTSPAVFCTYRFVVEGLGQACGLAEGQRASRLTSCGFSLGVARSLGEGPLQALEHSIGGS